MDRALRELPSWKSHEDFLIFSFKDLAYDWDITFFLDPVSASADTERPFKTPARPCLVFMVCFDDLVTSLIVLSRVNLLIWWEMYEPDVNRLRITALSRYTPALIISCHFPRLYATFSNFPSLYATVLKPSPPFIEVSHHCFKAEYGCSEVTSQYITFHPLLKVTCPPIQDTCRTLETVPNTVQNRIFRRYPLHVNWPPHRMTFNAVL